MINHLKTAAAAAAGAGIGVFCAGYLLVGIVETKIEAKLGRIERVVGTVTTAMEGAAVASDKVEGAVGRTIDSIRRLGRDSAP